MALFSGAGQAQMVRCYVCETIETVLEEKYQNLFVNKAERGVPLSSTKDLHNNNLCTIMHGKFVFHN